MCVICPLRPYCDQIPWSLHRCKIIQPDLKLPLRRAVSIDRKQLTLYIQHYSLIPCPALNKMGIGFSRSHSSRQLVSNEVHDVNSGGIVKVSLPIITTSTGQCNLSLEDGTTVTLDKFLSFRGQDLFTLQGYPYKMRLWLPPVVRKVKSQSVHNASFDCLHLSTSVGTIRMLTRSGQLTHVRTRSKRGFREKKVLSRT
jgi:hypothetical protein